MIGMRCQYPDCKKKLTLVMQLSNKCQCDKMFCNKHRFPNTHDCTINHKELGKEQLMRKLTKVTPEKILSI